MQEFSEREPALYMENRSEKMLRQIPEGYVTLHIAILKQEKQAQGKDCIQNYILLCSPGKWK